MKEFKFMVTHKSSNFIFSTYLHSMNIYLLPLLYISSNLDGHLFLKESSIAHIASIFVRSDSQKSITRVIVIMIGPSWFWSRPMKLKSQKASFPKLRRRQGSTCPPLVNVHPNPGPKEKSRRRGAKKETKMTPLAKKEKKQIEKLTAESMLGADIAQLIGRKEETVRK